MDLHAGQRFMKQQLTLFALGADTPLRAGGGGRGVLSARCRAVLRNSPTLGPSLSERVFFFFLEDFLKENKRKQKKTLFRVST